MRVSIIMATFNRAHLLCRSLACYAKQTHRDFEIIVVDDNSDDDTRSWCQNTQPFARQLDLKYVWLRKPNGCQWRDGASIINFALRAAEGDLIIATHPEVMPGFKSIESLAALAADTKSLTPYLACKPYYLTTAQQALIDTVPWRDQGPVAVRRLPQFYGQERSAEFRGDPDYLPENIERVRTWESFVFGGLTRKGWRLLGGIPQTAQWGSVDVSFLKLRQQYGITTLTPDDPQTYCVHQNHDGPNDNPTPRDLARAIGGVVDRRDNIRW